MKKIIKTALLTFIFTSSGFSNETNDLFWKTSAGSFQSERYFKGTQITKNNIHKLEKLWEYNSGSTDKFNTVQASPIFIKDQLIIVNLSGELISISPTNGKTNWKVKLNTPLGRRGFTYHENEDDSLSGIYISSGNEVLQISENGNIKGKFETGLSLLHPIINDNMLYIATLKKGIKAFSLKDKKKIWETPISKNSVNPRIWSGFSYDKISKSLYVVTSNPGGVIGENRDGDDFSVSLISVSAETGKINWHYKHIINDVWDFDLIGNPIIIRNLKINKKNQPTNTIISLTKTGDVIMLDLETGKPIFENSIKKILVEQSDMEDVFLSRYQKKYLTPQKYSSIEINLDKDFNHLDLDNQIYMRNKLRHARAGIFVPPSVNYDVITYGLHGGAEWQGGSVFSDSLNSYLIIPSNNNPWIIRIQYQDERYLQILDFLNSKSLKKFYNFYLSLKNFFFSNSKLIKKDISNAPMSEENINSNSIDTSFKNRNNINKFFQSSSKKYNFADKIYRHIPFTYKNLIYQKKCSSCHGNARQGRLDTEDRGDNFYPSLVGITTTNKILQVNDYNKLKKIHAINNINLEFSDKEYDLIFKSFDEYDQKLKNNGKITLEGSWQVLLDKYGLPATKPPWGYLTNIDLYDGKIKWQVPFGSRLVNNSKKIDGDINFGGVLSSKSKIIFATGNPDPYAYAYDLDTGEEVWMHKLPYSGSAQPMAFNYRGCDVIVFTATGGRFVGYKRNGDATIAFKLSDCDFNS